MTKTPRRFVRWLPVAAGAVLLAGCANGFNPSIGLGVGIPIGGGNFGLGGGVTIPLGGGSPSVGVGLGGGTSVGNVGVGASIGTSTTLDNLGGSKKQEPAVPAAVEQPQSQPATSTTQGAFANWPWGTQKVQ